MKSIQICIQITDLVFAFCITTLKLCTCLEVENGLVGVFGARGISHSYPLCREDLTGEMGGWLQFLPDLLAPLCHCENAGSRHAFPSQ